MHVWTDRCDQHYSLDHVISAHRSQNQGRQNRLNQHLSQPPPTDVLATAATTSSTAAAAPAAAAAAAAGDSKATDADVADAATAAAVAAKALSGSPIQNISR